MSTNGTDGHDEIAARLKREAAFHDHTAQSDTRAPADKFYSVTLRSQQFYKQTLFAGIDGKSILEYGCGTGSNTVDLARSGALVTGIDISPGALEVAQEAVNAAGVSGRVDLRVMDAERLELPDASFDRVCGTGILHHLDLEACYREIRRVLRPGGIAVFEEPMGHNPLINWYRNRTPHMRTPDEHPLLMADIRKARSVFREVDARFYHLSSLALVPLRNTPLFPPLYALAEGFDRALMTVVPPLKGWAWMTVIVLKV